MDDEIEEKMSLMEKVNEKKDKLNESTDSNSFDDDASPPDNGPCYISCCNWCGSMYQRFDSPFVTYFAVMNINHGLWISAALAAKDYYKEYL